MLLLPAGTSMAPCRDNWWAVDQFPCPLLGSRERTEILMVAYVNKNTDSNKALHKTYSDKGSGADTTRQGKYRLSLRTSEQSDRCPTRSDLVRHRSPAPPWRLASTCRLYKPLCQLTDVTSKLEVWQLVTTARAQRSPRSPEELP